MKVELMLQRALNRELVALFMGLAIAYSEQAQGASPQYFGRYTAGSFFAKESFGELSDGTGKNDFLLISNRLYTRFTGLSNRQTECVLDLRDKHDFFDKLDAERLQLTSKNTFQVKQAFIQEPNPGGRLYGTLGRFSISEAGATNVDGAEIGWRWNPAMHTALFGGFDPLRPDQSALEFNSNSQVAGLYSLYQPIKKSWNENFYYANALVAKQTSKHLDRAFYFTNFVYEWSAPSLIMAALYLDFVPRIYIQNGIVSTSFKSPESLLHTLRVSRVDVIEYTRRKSVLSRLPSSPYTEGAWNVRHTFKPGMTLDVDGLYGIRSTDSRSLIEGSVGTHFAEIINRHFSASTKIGYRKNFTAREPFIEFGLGYFSKSWELGFDARAAISAESDGKTYHPLIAEINIAHYLSREFYATLSLQEAHTERVNILSGFLKISYRFGSKDLAPVRDGAPPRGRI